MSVAFDSKHNHIASVALAICCASIALLTGSAPAAAQSEPSQDAPPEVTVPNFWDPRGVGDRPTAPPDTIRFLASDDFPPFSFRDGTGRLTGFNIDLARALCEELDSACSLRIKSFDALVPALVREEGDAIIAGLASTEANTKTLLFSDPYLRLPARFAVLKGSGIEDVTPEAMAGKRISVTEGTVHDAFLERYFNDAKILTYASETEARAALGTEEADAHFGDGLSLSFWLNGETSADCCMFVGGPWLEPGYFDHSLTIAFRIEDTFRQEAINHALYRLQQNGTYSELYLRYFPVSFY
ncbi:transporter substrate-binding domain-containing protein [Stappia sp. ES.058]|uniref:transporter substrate-binding domain-containing protein n=1 Tax=Stappia sp. ES.058 TaxID=1881061 RepID=UPI000879CCC4|nr:transporter substrate-binding domain-containing protein [Stappia sp. ES.058]SDT93544.1 amino acid ABC transporter substrate-binding protein, PAAT family [Stappia sp. ES.058]